MRRWPILALALITSSLHAQTKLRFTAHVRYGERFVQPLRPGLFFVMDPSGGDWRFAIAPTPRGGNNFADCLAVPLRGPTNIDLLAWRFSPKAPQGYGQKPPVVQQFDFALTAALDDMDCKAAEAFTDPDETQKDDPRMPPYAARPHGTATVTIRAAQLKPGAQDMGAEFAVVDVEVEVLLPPAQTMKSAPH